MIKLSDGCYVAADEIMEVKISDYGANIHVRMKNGIGHCHDIPYGSSIYDELDRLIKEIDKQLVRN